MYKVFIDGKEGTTGLKIYERFLNRDDIELITLPEEDRKNPDKRKEAINTSDITFLCLPDIAAKESVSLVSNKHTKIIDTSTAHRVDENFAYGFPELGKEFLTKLQNSQFVSVPGCHASGAIAVLRPIVLSKIVNDDYPFSIISLTGYSGGGKKMIFEYENDPTVELSSPRIYGLNQEHKHLKEITKYAMLKHKPLFNPIVAPYFSGMLVSVGIICDMQIHQIHQIFRDYYCNDSIVKVLPLSTEIKMMGSNNLSGYDNMEIGVFGSDGRYTIMARFDNLGKGASGAAIECMNIMLGLPKETGLKLKEE